MKRKKGPITIRPDIVLVYVIICFQYFINIQVTRIFFLNFIISQTIDHNMYSKISFNIKQYIEMVILVIDRLSLQI